MQGVGPLQEKLLFYMCLCHTRSAIRQGEGRVSGVISGKVPRCTTIIRPGPILLIYCGSSVVVALFVQVHVLIVEMSLAFLCPFIHWLFFSSIISRSYQGAITKHTPDFAVLQSSSTVPSQIIVFDETTTGLFYKYISHWTINTSFIF